MKNLNIYSNSGASTNLEFLAGVAYSVIGNGYKPDIVDGNSSGALIAPLIAMNRLEDLKHLALNYSLKSVFSSIPVNEKGTPTLKGVYRAATGKSSLGVMDNLYTTLTEAFTLKDFVHWKYNTAMPDIYVACVNYQTGKLHKVDLRKLNDYQLAIDYIMASASIPLMAEYIKIQGNYYYDGGARTHTLAPYMQQMYKGKIKRHVSVYSRPQDFKIPRPDLKGNVGSILNRTLEIMVMQLSRGNQETEMTFRKQNGLPLTDMVFTPHLLKNKTYDFGNNQEKFDLGCSEGLKIKM